VRTPAAVLVRNALLRRRPRRALRRTGDFLRDGDFDQCGEFSFRI
jgi:hypothetical protein